MALFKSLFKSQAARESENRLRLRQGKSRIQQYLKRCRTVAEKYFQLCRQAYQLGDTEHFQQLAIHHLNARRSVNRWERFLIKLEALEMRRDEVSATSDFLRSMATVTNSILRGASPVEIGRLQANIGRALEASRSQEEMLDLAMEACGNSLMEGERDEPLLLDAMVPMMESKAASNSRSATDKKIAGQAATIPDKLDADIARALKELEASLSSRAD